MMNPVDTGKQKLWTPVGVVAGWRRNWSDVERSGAETLRSVKPCLAEASPLATREGWRPHGRRSSLETTLGVGLVSARPAPFLYARGWVLDLTRSYAPC